MSIENLQRIIGFQGIKADVESFSATRKEIAFAYATDTEELGININGSWIWISTTAFRELLVDNSGNILFDDNNDVLYEG